MLGLETSTCDHTYFCCNVLLPSLEPAATTPDSIRISMRAVSRKHFPSIDINDMHV